MRKQDKRNLEFSKRILVYICAEVLIVTILGFTLAFYCVFKNCSSSLPWISTLVSAAWAAFGTATAFYLNMAKSDHKQGGVTYLNASRGAEQNNNTDNFYP